MFHFLLYDDKRLAQLNRREKQALVNNAIKNYRKNTPINRLQRLATLGVLLLLPACAIYYFFSSGLALAWLCLSTLTVAAILAHKETPDILPYLDMELKGKT